MEDTMLKQKRILGLSLGIFIVVTNVVSILLSFLTSKFNLSNDQNMYLILYLTNAFSIYLIGYAVFFTLLKKVKCCTKKEKLKLKFSELLLLICITIGGSQFINIVTQLILNIIKIFTNSSINNDVSNLLENSNPLLAFIFAGILGPVFEELIFRGSLLKRIRLYGDKTAVIYTAIAFGLFHTNINQIPYAIACGLVFGYVMVKTNNIKWSILLHIMLNSFSIILLALLKANLILPIFLVYIILTVCIILTLVFVPIKLTSGKVIIPNESEYSKRNLYKNLGCIISAIIILILTIVNAFL